MTDKGDKSNYLRVNIKKNSDRTFKLFQLHLAEKKVNRIGLTMSKSFKSRETLAGKTLLHKYESSLGRKCVWNYMAVVGMLSYLQGSKRPEISMYIHQCARFFSDSRLVHEHTVRCIANYLASTSTYLDFTDENQQVSTHKIVYNPDK